MTQDYKVKDISQADFGRKEISLAETEMPGLMALRKEYKGKKKIIGICLGFQQILHCENGKIVEQKKIYHGFQSRIKVTSKNSLFKKNSQFKVGR